MSRPAPHELYYRAVEEVGDLEDRAAIRERYRELLAEHGHLVPRPACTCGKPEHEPGCPRYNDRRRPCGWLPGERRRNVLRPPQLALSVWQPWAWLLVQGVKDVENRPWATAHRGRLWIHASLRFDEDAYQALLAEGVDLPPADQLPRGALVGAVELVGCVQDALSRWAVPGQWHWQIGQHWMLPEPISCRGRQRLFRVDQEVAAA